MADDHVSIIANGRIVQIKHAQVSDTGRYTCVATNLAGEDEKDFDVNIQGELVGLVLGLILWKFTPPGIKSVSSKKSTNWGLKFFFLFFIYCSTSTFQ